MHDNSFDDDDDDAASTLSDLSDFADDDVTSGSKRGRGSNKSAMVSDCVAMKKPQEASNDVS